MKLLTIVGARPQIIKAAALSRAVAAVGQGRVVEHLLHTGQHYDHSLSGRFFDELGVPRPDFNLGVGSGPHGWQTARMLEGVEQILLGNHYDGVVVYGDTNSTLAGALAASKLHLPLFHIEAGLRSHNMAMPEEVNRVVADRLASLLFAPTAEACTNLRREGYVENTIVESGDVMYDNALHFSAMAEQAPSLATSLGLEHKRFVLATVHRDFNTDTPERLRAIVAALEEVDRHFMPVVMPLHPRTKDRLGSYQPRITAVLQPVGYLEMLQLERHAHVVVTDSGGVQKEAYFLATPSVILRPETEWTEIVAAGAAKLVDADPKAIVDACQTLQQPSPASTNLYGDGHAAEKIIAKIIAFAQ